MHYLVLDWPKPMRLILHFQNRLKQELALDQLDQMSQLLIDYRFLQDYKALRFQCFQPLLCS